MADCLLIRVDVGANRKRMSTLKTIVPLSEGGVVPSHSLRSSMHALESTRPSLSVCMVASEAVLRDLLPNGGGGEEDGDGNNVQCWQSCVVQRTFWRSTEDCC